MAGNVIFTAPPGTGHAVRGKTLVDLLYDACARYTNPRALNQPTADGDWTPLSLDDFRAAAEETAMGLLDLGLERGQHVAFFMESDVPFCVADMGCLLAGLIDVPIYLTSAEEAIIYIINHAESKALFVSNEALLAEIAPLLNQTPEVRHIILAEGRGGATLLPDGIELLTMEVLRARGRARLDEAPRAIDDLRAQIDPHDTATIIYTSGTTGRPKGVMLSHENISFNAMTSYSGLKGYRAGPKDEVGISFLPMTHIFARALYYGFVAMGTSLYFTTPDDLSEALAKVRPTIFASVPRLLEKVYARIQEKTTQLSGAKHALASWALELAQRYELGQVRGPQYQLADLLVYSKWREALGGRVRWIICGGAALSADLANVFGAADVPVYQGYGLTETSPVITYNRPGRNRAGTVGEPLPDVEVTLAEDGEVLTRGPHVMKGYFKEPEKTSAVLDDDGWFHTGDVGRFTEDGFLIITDRKKDLFKLSTGKYVMPQPLETRLGIEGLIEHAVVVGAERKFTGALVFPEQDNLRVYARSQGLDADAPVEALLKEPTVIARYQALVHEANRGMEPWSTIKRFALVPGHLTVDDGLLTPTLKVKRAAVRDAFADAITALYDDEAEPEKTVVVREIH